MNIITARFARFENRKMNENTNCVLGRLVKRWPNMQTGCDATLLLRNSRYLRDQDFLGSPQHSMCLYFQIPKSTTLATPDKIEFRS